MIYFLQPVDGGPVKIGYSVNVERRRKALESRYSKSLVLLATLPGGRDKEREIHARFAHLRMRMTEQFRPASDLMEFIGQPSLASPDPETHPEMQSKPARFWSKANLDVDVARLVRRVAHFKRRDPHELVNEILRTALQQRNKPSMRKATKKPR